MASYENYLNHDGQNTSPGSSSGSNRSLGATPESKNTDFLSPEPKSSSGKSSTLKQTISPRQDGSSDDPNDVFIDSINSKRKGGLSATAHAFQPYAIPHAPAPGAGLSRSLPVKQAPTTVDPNIAFLTDSLLATSKTTKIGIFTTDTRSSRFLKIVSILGAQVKLLVDASLEKLRQGGWSPKGSFRPGEVNDALYVRLSNIGDAQHFCQAVKVDHPANLEVTYVEATEWATVRSFYIWIRFC
ncbi:hypothetical protein BGZ60DRAFT_215863 [Tricladium varicosporioides]|nr:hypothetical protein BGZ60DRAFT_215863 [Hymenoscyphus varicosporioides]